MSCPRQHPAAPSGASAAPPCPHLAHQPRHRAPIWRISRATVHRATAIPSKGHGAARGTLQPHLAHQPRHRAPRHRDPFAPKPPPDLAHAVDAEVLLEDASDLRPPLGVAPGTGRRPGGVATARSVGMAPRRGDRQHPADRLDPVDAAVIVDEGDHRFEGRSSSARAKHALALLRVSLACLSARTSRSSARMRSRSSPVGPGLFPSSRSARRSQSREPSRGGSPASRPPNAPPQTATRARLRAQAPSAPRARAARPGAAFFSSRFP